jgi:carbonic anhydrase
MDHVVDGILKSKPDVSPDHRELFGELATEALADLPHVKAWLGHVRSAVEVVRARHGHCGPEHLGELTRENVLQQLQHLRTHPVVAARVRAGSLQLHGWVYDIETGEVSCHEEETDSFMPIAERFERLAARKAAASA